MVKIHPSDRIIFDIIAKRALSFDELLLVLSASNFKPNDLLKETQEDVVRCWVTESLNGLVEQSCVKLDNDGTYSLNYQWL